LASGHSCGHVIARQKAQFIRWTCANLHNHTPEEQAMQAQHVDYTSLKVGDLVIEVTSPRNRTRHYCLRKVVSIGPKTVLLSSRTWDRNDYPFWNVKLGIPIGYRISRNYRTGRKIYVYSEELFRTLEYFAIFDGRMWDQ